MVVKQSREAENKRPSITGLVTTAALNRKVTYIENRKPGHY